MSSDSSSDHEERGTWSVPKTVIFFKRWKTPKATEVTLEVMRYLESISKVTLFLNAPPQEETGYSDLHEFRKSNLKPDMIVCIGGDGTVIYAASQFPVDMPPTLCFAMGSLGFLTPFALDSYKRVLSKIFDSEYKQNEHAPYPITSRLRLLATINRSDHARNMNDEKKDIMEPKEAGVCELNRHVVMNEVLIDRGPSTQMINLDTFVDRHHLTTVNADGVILATPTGSTAYSLSAGGSVVMPSIEAILLTPICPHSLSFRPILLRSDCVIRVEVPINARNCPYVSFDGKDSTRLNPGDAVIIEVSQSPLKLFDSSDGFDWAHGLKFKLNWNLRENQKPLDDDASLPSPSSTYLKKKNNERTTTMKKKKRKKDNDKGEVHTKMRRRKIQGDDEDA